MNLDSDLKTCASGGWLFGARRSIVTFSVSVVAATLVVVLLLWWPYASSDWVGAEPVVMHGSDWRLVTGEGGAQADGFEIRRSGARGAAVAQGSIPTLDARRFPVLEWHVDGLRAGQELQLAWSRADHPRLPHARVLSRGETGRGTLDLRGDPQWQGQVVAIALIVRGEVQEPIWIRRLELRSAAGTLPGLVAFMARDWSASGGWTGRSINFNKDSEPGRLFTPVSTVALWVALGGLFYLLMNPPWRGFRSLMPYALILISGWFVLDLRWQKDLLARVSQSAELYAGLDDGERQLAGPDRALYPFVSALREHLPGSLARIFIVSAEPDGSTVGRVRYHLLPHNLSTGSTHLPSAEQARPGDYVLLLSPTRHIRYDAEHGLLIAGESRLPVERVYARPSMGELFRVRGGS